jgi:hypothetical protein
LASHAAADQASQDLLNVAGGDVLRPYRAQVREGLLNRAREGRFDMPCTNSAAVSQVLDIGIEKLLEGPQARSSLAGTFLAGRDLFTARPLSLYITRRSLDSDEIGQLRPGLLELHSTVTGRLFEPPDPEDGRRGRSSRACLQGFSPLVTSRVLQ